ncbi:MAG: iron ABC transporter permease [Spirochaetales bacterium]|jgi:iron(III) transport system permease protein|nr:iron ABC transporter permease [Spirochaetales bacterium]
MRRALFWGALVLAAGFVFVLPVLRLVQTSFIQEGAFSLDAYRDVLNRAASWKAAGNTLVIGVASTLGALVLGTAFAWLTAYTDIMFAPAIRFLAFLPYILPSYSIALAWRLFCSPNGAVAALFAVLPGSPAPPNLYGYGGIIFMHVLTSFPPVFLLMASALRRVPRDMEWAARTAGVKNLRVFWYINLPVMAPACLSAGALTFLSVIDNFGIPAILGIPAGIPVLPTYIYEQIAGMTGASVFSRGAVLALLLIAISLLGPLLQKVLPHPPADIEAILPDNSPRVFLGRLRLPLSLCAGGLLFFLSIVPVCFMAGTALKQAMGLPLSADNFTLSNFSFVLLENLKSRRAIFNSLWLAAVCALLCMAAGTALAVSLAKRKSRWPRVVEAMIQIPYSVPGIVLSLCMILFWMQPLPGFFPGVYGTSKILLIVYLTRFLVVQTKASYSAVANFDPGMEDAVRVCGASPLAGWIKIILPLLLPGILSGAVMVFTGVLTELTLSSLLWSVGSETIGATVLNFEQAGSLKYSSALSSAVCLAVILLFFLSHLPGRYKAKAHTGD